MIYLLIDGPPVEDPYFNAAQPLFSCRTYDPLGFF